MTAKRLITALAVAAVGAAVLAGCSPTASPTPSATNSPSPTSTAAGPVDPPKDEEAAITASEALLKVWLTTRGEVNAAGGKDTSRLEALATGKALTLTLNDAKQISTGPQLNVDGKNIDGPAKTKGAITYEPISAYGQEFQKTPNGLVTVHACQDISAYKIFASDGSAGMQPADKRTVVDYQVIYDTTKKAWLVYDVISSSQTC